MDTSITIKAVGKLTSVPNNNIARLMYYLSCVNNCLDKDGQSSLLDSRHTDFRNYDKLQDEEQTLIVLLSLLLSPDELIGVCFFVVDEGAACLRGSSNEFLETTSAKSFLGALYSQNKVFVFKGDEVQTSRVMVCTKGWLQNNFMVPFSGEVGRLQELDNGSKMSNNRCKEAEKCPKFERLDDAHCQQYTHPCPYQQSCWSRTDPQHLRLFTHDSNLPKCTAFVCSRLTDPAHRRQFHHPGRRDYMIACRFASACRSMSDLQHVHKYYH